MSYLKERSRTVPLRTVDSTQPPSSRVRHPEATTPLRSTLVLPEHLQGRPEVEKEENPEPRHTSERVSLRKGGVSVPMLPDRDGDPSLKPIIYSPLTIRPPAPGVQGGEGRRSETGRTGENETGMYGSRCLRLGVCLSDTTTVHRMPRLRLQIKTPSRDP